MRKIQIRWISLIFLLIFLVACEGTLPENETGLSGTDIAQNLITPTLGETPTPFPTPTPVLPRYDDVAESLPNTEIEFWYVWDRYGIDPYQEMAIQFNATNEYDIRATAVNQNGYGELARAVDDGITTNELPDLAMGYNYQYLDWDATDEIIVDLTPYLTDVVFGFNQETIADFYPVFWEHDLIGNYRYGLPAQRAGQMLFYNVTWAKELGFDTPPSTSDEFKQQACAAARKNDDSTGGWFINTSTASMTSWLYAFDGEIGSGAEGYDFKEAEISSAFEFLYDLITAGCAWQPGTLYPNQEFASRRGLFFSSSIAGIPFQLNAFEDADSKDTWVPIPYPGNDGDPVITVYGPSYVMLRSGDEEQLAAWLFLQYLLEPSNQALQIEDTGGFPISRSTVSLIEGTDVATPQWFAAVELLDYGRFEPRLSSWRTVRAALQDAANILFSQFNPPTIADLLDQLQATAEELHAESGGN